DDPGRAAGPEERDGFGNAEFQRQEIPLLSVPDQLSTRVGKRIPEAGIRYEGAGILFEIRSQDRPVQSTGLYHSYAPDRGPVRRQRESHPGQLQEPAAGGQGQEPAADEYRLRYGPADPRGGIQIHRQNLRPSARSTCERQFSAGHSRPAGKYPALLQGPGGSSHDQVRSRCLGKGPARTGAPETGGAASQAGDPGDSGELKGCRGRRFAATANPGIATKSGQLLNFRRDRSRTGMGAPKKWQTIRNVIPSRAGKADNPASKGTSPASRRTRRDKVVSNRTNSGSRRRAAKTKRITRISTASAARPSSKIF